MVQHCAGGIGHVRYVNILTWLRGFQVKLLYLVLLSLYPSLFWELRDKRNLKNLQFLPESLGAMLEYWYIERGLFENGGSFTSSRNASNIFRQHYFGEIGKRSSRWSFWICLEVKLWQANIMSIVTSSFSKSFVHTMFSIHATTQSLRFEEHFFEKLRFRDGLVWTVGLTGETNLRFQIPQAYCGRGVNWEVNACDTLTKPA